LDKSDDDSEIMMSVALLIHDHEENHMPRFRGSVPEQFLG
jgi:CRISPR/Cas system-associated endonuclease Cas3-HD